MDNLSDIRVLLVARKGSSTQVLRTVFAVAGLAKVISVPEASWGIELLRTEHFHAVFVEGTMEYENMPFALAARRLPSMINPMIAMFAVFPEARRRDVEKARDLGVHDVICRPVSPKTVMTKLRAALVAPRSFIAAPSFFGPDRRATRPGAPPLKDRRQRTTRKVSVAMV